MRAKNICAYNATCCLYAQLHHWVFFNSLNCIIKKNTSLNNPKAPDSPVKCDQALCALKSSRFLAKFA